MMDATAPLWEMFRERRDVASRERLALAYHKLAREQAMQMVGRVPSVKIDDLERYGMMGLRTAIERFDPDRGVPFELFARRRVRGAIYDYLRTLTLGRARADADIPEGSPDDGEVSRRLAAGLLRDVGGDVRLIEDDGVDADVRRAVEALPVPHKVVVGLFYCNGIAPEVIGGVLGISESDVVRLRSEALAHIRTQLALQD